MDVILLHGNNEIKARLPVSPSPGLAWLCVQMTEEVALCLSDTESKPMMCLRLVDSTSREQVCDAACLASCPSLDIRSYFRMSQCWLFARYHIVKNNGVVILSLRLLFNLEKSPEKKSLNVSLFTVI